MILLLNLVPFFILAIGAFLIYRAYKAKENQPLKFVSAIVGTLLALCIYVMALPSYVPKGEPVYNLSAPTEEVVERDAKNELLVPDLEENKKALADVMDWKRRVKENQEGVDADQPEDEQP